MMLTRNLFQCETEPVPNREIALLIRCRSRIG
jgi:hypothetical protein